MNLNEYVETCPACKSELSMKEEDKNCCFECGAEFSMTQRHYALERPDIYLSKVLTINGEQKTVIELADGRVDGKIVAVFGVFAVTDQGIECLDHYYAISRWELTEKDWATHMSEKTWVNIDDFKDALKCAIELEEDS